ncbi:hypothetical protein YC2023_032735 [Brassica napus]
MHARRWCWPTLSDKLDNPYDHINHGGVNILKLVQLDQPPVIQPKSKCNGSPTLILSVPSYAEISSDQSVRKRFKDLILKTGGNGTHMNKFAKEYYTESGGKYYITKGWRKFCLDNSCEIGDLFVFNVVGDGKTTPLMCVCPERKECSEILSKYLSRKSGESSHR